MRQTKIQMYELGVEASGTVGNNSGLYPCPLCRELFNIDDLTEEHVPPKSVGGKVLTLTCEKCNNTAGYEVQSHESERMKEKEFYSGNIEKPINLELSTTQGVVRGKVSMADDMRVLNVDLDRMHPDMYLLEDVEMSGAAIHRLGRGYDWHKSRVSDLRNSLLWVFARYGYTMVMADCFDPIRADIKRGVSDNSKWGLRTDFEYVQKLQEHSNSPIILVTAEPDGALIVANGEYGCLLPSPICPDPYTDLDDNYARISIANGYFSVPAKMELKWDFSPPK